MAGSTLCTAAMKSHVLQLPLLLISARLPTVMAQQQPVFDFGRVVAQVSSDDMPEASGLVASWGSNDLLWTHNDSGEGPYIHALSTSGQYLGGYHLGVPNTDLEDIAVGPGPDPALAYIYIGDIGNNDFGKPSRTSIRVHRLVEPPAPLEGETVRLEGVGVDTITLLYPSDEEYIDAETLLIDPIQGQILIVRKANRKGGVYTSPAYTTSRTGSFTIQLEYKGEIQMDLNPTGGDISRDGQEILVKRPDSVFYWQRNDYASVSEALVSERGAEQLYLKEPQGEAICFDPDGTGYYTISEAGSRSETPLLYYPRKVAPPTPRPTSSLPFFTRLTPRPSAVSTMSPSPRPTSQQPISIEPTRGPTIVPTLTPSSQPTSSSQQPTTVEPTLDPPTIKPTLVLASDLGEPPPRLMEFAVSAAERNVTGSFESSTNSTNNATTAFVDDHGDNEDVHLVTVTSRTNEGEMGNAEHGGGDFGGEDMDDGP